MRHQLLLQKCVFLLLFLSAIITQAAYFKNIPVRLTQPNGVPLTVYASGDEYYNWIHDINNYTIIKNPLSGFYVFANLQGEDLVPTSYIVGTTDPAIEGLIPGMNIPGWKMELIRKTVLESTPVKPSIIPPSAPLNPDISGTVNNIVVFIRFSDQSEFTEPITTYDNMFNNNAAGANSMYNYFKDVSYNSMFVPSTFYPLPSGTVIISYQDSHPRAYYMPYDSVNNPTGYLDSEKTSREHTLLKNAVEAIASQVPSGLNIDYDNDGHVDNVCFIVKGGTTAWNTLLWPHRWSLFSQTCFINNKRVWDYNFQLETFLSSSGVGVLAHEMTHTFGCPDLYHYNGDGFSPVGPWDLMDGNSNPPQHIGAFMKKKYTGWIADIPTITQPGTYTLSPLVNEANNAYKLITANSSTEYFILEYRRKTGTFEGSLPESGLLIYRINTLAGNGNSGGPPDEVYLYRPGGTDTTNGNPYSANFSLASGRTSFSDNTNPNDWLSDGITLGGISIINITAADTTISFTVNMNTLAEFNANQTTTCINQTIFFTDQTFGAPTSWSWSITPSTYSFVNGTTSSSQNPQIQFTAAGSYSVTLTASGPNGTDTLTKNDYIQILPAFSAPLSEDFESGGFTNNNWTINNPDALTTWDIFTGAGGNSPSTKCATVNFYNYSSYHAFDDLIAKPITLAEGSMAKLLFKVAYRQYDDTYHDTLKILLSTNCGSTYSYTIYDRGDAALATGPPMTTFFVPYAASDWRTDTIDLSAFAGQTVTIAFRAINGYGNNLYIDDIYLTGSTPLLSNFSGEPTSLCQGGNVQFTDLSSGSPTSWAWTFGDGGISSLQNPSHQYNSPGPHSVSLTVSNSEGSHTLTQNNYITVNPLQVVSASITQNPPGSICANSTVTFIATTVNGGQNPTYQWRKNGIPVGTNSNSYSASSLVNGDVVHCIVTSTLSCASNNPATSNSIQVSVLQSLLPSVSIVASPSNIICQGTTVTFTATPVNGGDSPSYQWKLNGTNVGNNSTKYITNSLVSGDVVSCVMTSAYPCVTLNPVTSNLIVMTVNPILTASLSITADPPGTVCKGTHIVFTATPVNGGTSPSYQWKVNGGNVGSNSPVFASSSLQQGDVVNCQMTSSASCLLSNPVNSNSIVASIQEMPVVNLGNDTTIPLSNTLILDAGAGYASYAWNTGATSQILLVDSTGEYAVTVTDNIGCTGSDMISVTVGYFSLQGKVGYNNTAFTPMNNSTVTLKQGNTIITNTITDIEGSYSFDGLPLGTYKIYTSSSKTWGGVNSIDALMIMKHFVGMSFLTGLPLKAANVDYIPSINAIDALSVQKRTVGLMSSFPVGDWVFETPTITIDGLAPVYKDIRALTTGDVNCSFTPAAKYENGVVMIQSGQPCLYQGSTIDIPVRADQSLDLGAITLFLAYPSDKLYFQGITMESGMEKNLVYNENDGMIAVSWASLKSLSLSPGDILLHIHFIITQKGTQGYVLSCLPGSEFADADGIPFETVTLKQPYLSTNEHQPVADLQVYPNPAMDQLSLQLVLPEGDYVEIELYNAQGQKIKTLFNQYFNKGQHHLQWDGNIDSGSKPGPGTYYVKMITLHQSKVIPIIFVP